MIAATATKEMSKGKEQEKALMGCEDKDGKCKREKKKRIEQRRKEKRREAGNVSKNGKGLDLFTFMAAWSNRL